jgi:hypothetical protein
MESTLDDRGDGFSFSSDPPVGLTASSRLKDANYWIVLASALARLREGDFSIFDAVTDAMKRTDDGEFWNVCGLFFAFAAPYSEIGNISKVFTRDVLAQSPAAIRLHCKLLAHSMGPWVVDSVLALYESTLDPDVRVLGADYLSHMLEDEPGEVDAGPVRKLQSHLPPEFAEHYRDYDEYAQVVRAVRDRIVDASGSDQIPVLGGKPFSIVELARRIIEHARKGEDSTRTNFERMVFEATTGIPCRDFFQQDNPWAFRPLSAAAIAEDFLRSEAAASFTPGVRYFFGRPVPP